jgi:trypsin
MTPATPLRRGLLALGVLLATGAVASPAPAVVGGRPVDIAAFPYQAALVQSAKTAVQGQYCGATIRDERHVVTAAHCVFDNYLTPAGEAIDPSGLDVLVGTTRLSDEAAGQRLDVAEVAVHPDFESAGSGADAAVLTLAEPIALGPEAAPLEIMAGDEWTAVPPAAPVVVSGWGATTAPDPPSGQGTDPADVLQGVELPLVDDGACAAAYGTMIVAFDAARMLCAGEEAGGEDACQGDSGGPLAKRAGLLAGDPADRLVGIVSTGWGCGVAGFPGIYAEAAGPSLRSFLTLPHPGRAATNATRPALERAGGPTPAPGDVLTCSPGVWRDARSFAYEFVRGATALTALGPERTYTVRAADAGGAIACVVRGEGPYGGAWAQSDAIVFPAVAAAPGPPPAVAPPARDVNAPVARVVHAACRRATCTLELRVTDAGLSAGIGHVRVTVRSRYRATCRRAGRRWPCLRHRTRAVTVTRRSATRFRAVARRLPTGTHAFTALAVDRAGHRQRLPTRRTLRTRRAAR